MEHLLLLAKVLAVSGLLIGAISFRMRTFSASSWLASDSRPLDAASALRLREIREYIAGGAEQDHPHSIIRMAAADRRLGPTNQVALLR